MTTQYALIKEFFINHPNRKIPTAEAVDWVTKEYTRRTGRHFRDPDRSIRQLHQQGFCKKSAKGFIAMTQVVLRR